MGFKSCLETRERASFKAVPARSPSRPPTAYPEWVVGRGSGPAPQNAPGAFSNRLSDEGFADADPVGGEDGGDQ